jgi:hypothetical protein
MTITNTEADLFAVLMNGNWSIATAVPAAKYGVTNSEHSIWSEQETTAWIGHVGKEDMAINLARRSANSAAGGVEVKADDHDDWSFQQRVGGWMQECFTPGIIADKLERNDRFIEEALELVQSLNYSADRAHALVDYVFGREKGEPSQEVGGVMVTLAALCNPNDLSMDMAAETELARILDPAIVLKIRAKQASKPTGSALPIPHPSSSVSAEVTVTDEMVERGARAMDPEAFGRDFPVMAAKHYEVRRSIALKKVRAALLAALNGKE